MLSYDISLWNTKKALYLWELLQNISLQLCQWLARWDFLHRYLSISCYDDVFFNFYFFIAVHIGKTCSKSYKWYKPYKLAQSCKTCTIVFFTYCFISLLTLSKFPQCFEVLMFNIETVVFTNIINTVYTFFILWKCSHDRDQNISRKFF